MTETIISGIAIGMLFFIALREITRLNYEILQLRETISKAIKGIEKELEKRSKLKEEKK